MRQAKKVDHFPSAVAVASFLRGGAGKHGDRRTKRKRDRGAQQRWAIKEQR